MRLMSGSRWYGGNGYLTKMVEYIKEIGEEPKKRKCVLSYLRK